MNVPALPTANAVLNASSAVCLALGFLWIKQGRKRAHARAMLTATAFSALFLAGYLYYHFAVVPEVGHTSFRREGIVRGLYYGMLISHILLAALNLPMILRTLWLARRQDWERHRRWARWTFPIWSYVSVTGVLVYLCLYVWNPPAVVG